MPALHQSCSVSSTNRLQKRLCSYGPSVDQDVNIITFAPSNIRGRIHPLQLSSPGASESVGGEEIGIILPACLPRTSYNYLRYPQLRELLESSFHH